MRLPEDAPCVYAVVGSDECDDCALGWPCTGSCPDVNFSPAEMDCYEPVRT
jgi:hypothetical protein